MNIHQQSRPLGDHEYREDPLSLKELKTNGVKQIQFSAESNQSEKNQKSE